MTVYMAGPVLDGTRPKGGTIHRRKGTRTVCGRVPAASWLLVVWAPPAGCCKTCVGRTP